MESERDIRAQILALLQEKLQRLSINENELGSHFDLVKSGLVNSLEFVDMVSFLEKANQVEIDFEEALESGELTTLGGLVKVFMIKK